MQIGESATSSMMATATQPVGAEPTRPIKKRKTGDNGDNGDNGNVIVANVSTQNSFATLTDNNKENDEIILTRNKNGNAPSIKTARIPPITVFNMDRSGLIKILQALGVKKYSLKLLRRAVQVFCDSTDDYKTLRTEMVNSGAYYYAHDLKEEKVYKVALLNLHRMPQEELQDELKIVGLTAVDIRVIQPKEKKHFDQVVYVVSFNRGTVKLAELKEKHSVVCYTKVRWEPYRRKGGVIQCTNCQRPGHGAKHCSMMPRCCFCGEDHISSACAVGITVMDVDGKAETPSTNKRCCNCNQDGHYASDPTCPTRLKYARSRQANPTRTKGNTGRTVNTTNKLDGRSFADVVQETIQSGQVRQTHAQASRSNQSGYVVQAITQAIRSGQNTSQITRSQCGAQSTTQVSNNQTSAKKSSQVLADQKRAAGAHSAVRASTSNCNNPPKDESAGNINEEPFTLEEISSLTFEIVSSLRDVRFMPRSQAFTTVLNVAFKYLYRND